MVFEESLGVWLPSRRIFSYGWVDELITVISVLRMYRLAMSDPAYVLIGL